MSSRSIEAQHQSNAPRDDRDRNFTSLKTRILHSMPISITASRDDF